MNSLNPLAQYLNDSIHKLVSIPEADHYPSYIWGAFTTWMLFWSVMMFYAYIYTQPCAKCKPYIYWAIFSWYQTIFWLF